MLAERPQTALALAVLVYVLLTVAPSAAQNGFSGDWKLDTGRSDPLRRDSGPLPETDMTIERLGDDLTVSLVYHVGAQDRPVHFTYVADGKPHDVASILGERSARARWKKEKLQVSYTLSRQTPQGAFDIDVTETWELSDDGAEIEIGYQTRVAERSLLRKEIYVRQPAASD